MRRDSAQTTGSSDSTTWDEWNAKLSYMYTSMLALTPPEELHTHHDGIVQILAMGLKPT